MRQKTIQIRAIGLAWLILCCALACNSRADTLVMNDGRQAALQGKIVSDDGTIVIFETCSNGVTMRRKIPKSQIASITTDAATGPGYCALPIFGTIGKTPQGGPYVSAKCFSRALEQVRAAKPQYVVLVIDSPGGSVAEMEEIIAAIRSAPELKFIAYVKEALSAAAVIAMACPTIYVAPDARIGAAVPYHVAPDGTPQNIDEKMQSAIRAAFRSAAQLGGHDPLLMRGMMEPEIILALASAGDTAGKAPSVVEATAAAALPADSIIKPNGRILTLTADESIKFGLAAGVCDSLDSIGSKLKGSDAADSAGWRQLDDRPWHAMLNAAKSEQIRSRSDALQNQKAAAVQHETKKVRDQIAQLDVQIKAARGRIAAISDSLFNLHQQSRRELEAARENYAREQDKARRHPDPRPHLIHAKDVHEANEAAILSRERNQAISLETQLEAARAEEKRLFGEQVRLQKSIPVE